MAHVMSDMSIQQGQGSISIFTGLDVLVNSAGIVVTGDTASLSLEDFDRCMNINTKAAFILSQKAIPYLRKSRGNIVHVSSVTGAIDSSLPLS